MLGAQRVAGGPFYERAAGPLLAVILAPLDAGPLLPWRPDERLSLLPLLWPAAGAVLSLLFLLIGGVQSLPALVAFPLAAAAGGTVVTEYARAALRKPRSILRKRRHYGAYLAHLGLVVTVVGIAASHFGQQEKDVTLTPGESVTVAGYMLTVTGSEQRQLLDHTELIAGMRFGDRTLEPSDRKSTRLNSS